jgi:aspartate/methionine/tyrosine aminotransferase
MDIRQFDLERFQSLHEHSVEFNLSESGVSPLTAGDLLDESDMRRLMEVPLGYAQTDGPHALKERIADHLGAEARNVLVTSATIEANFICAWHLIQPGDEVACMVPNYLQIFGLAESFGAVVRPFRLRAELGWQPDLEELAAAVTSKTRMITLVNPNNPTGSVLERSAMKRIVELAAAVDAWLLVDEIYRGSEHDGELSSSFWGTYEKVLVTGSLSKAYGLPGLRVGWVIAPEQLVDELWSRKDYTSITAATLSYELAERALEPAVLARILGRNRDLVVRNLGILRFWVDADDLLSLETPAAGAMTLVRYRHPIGSVELADRLRREKSVLVVPGSHFGLEGYLRIGYGIPSAELRIALGRVGELLEEIASD